MPEDSLAERDTLRRFLHQPGGAHWWNQYRTGFSPAFRDYVNREIIEKTPIEVVDTKDT